MFWSETESGFGNRAAHPHHEFRGVPPAPSVMCIDDTQRVREYFNQHSMVCKNTFVQIGLDVLTLTNFRHVPWPSKM